MSTPTTADIEKALTEEAFHTNPTLGVVVEPDTELKDMLVTYVGTKFDKEDVTVNMIVETMAAEFPEFVWSFAEENFLRGYQLGLEDAETLTRNPSEITEE